MGSCWRRVTTSNAYYWRAIFFRFVLTHRPYNKSGRKRGGRNQRNISHCTRTSQFVMFRIAVDNCFNSMALASFTNNINSSAYLWNNRTNHLQPYLSEPDSRLWRRSWLVHLKAPPQKYFHFFLWPVLLWQKHTEKWSEIDFQPSLELWTIYCLLTDVTTNRHQQF